MSKKSCPFDQGFSIWQSCYDRHLLMTSQAIYAVRNVVQSLTEVKIDALEGMVL